MRVWRRYRRRKASQHLAALDVALASVPTRFTLDHKVTHTYEPRPVPVSGIIQLHSDNGMPYALSFTVHGRDAHVGADIPSHVRHIDSIRFDYR